MALGDAKPTLVSIAVYIVVVVAGAVILMFMEREGMKKVPHNEEQRPTNVSSVQSNEKNLTEYTKIYIENHGSKEWTIADVSKLLEAIKERDTKNKKATVKDKDEDKWRREISLETFLTWEYFVLITLSTVGYGDICPISGGAKILTVLLQVIGIPINLYVFLTIAAFFTKCVSCLKRSLASKCQTRKPNKPDMPCFFFCIIIALLYVGAGGIALGFSQGWKWHDGIYWSFTAATTVGYGDLIPKSKAAFAFTFFGIIAMLMPVYALSQALQDGKEEEEEEECKEGRLMVKPEEL